MDFFLSDQFYQILFPACVIAFFMQFTTPTKRKTPTKKAGRRGVLRAKSRKVSVPSKRPKKAAKNKPKKWAKLPKYTREDIERIENIFNKREGVKPCEKWEFNYGGGIAP